MRKLLKILMYAWEKRRKKRKELKELLNQAGLKLIKVRSTSITLVCIIPISDKQGKYKIVDEADNSIIYNTGLTEDEAAEQMARYMNEATERYPKLSGDEALNKYMGKIKRLRNLKKIKNKFPKEPLPKEGYEIKIILDKKGIFRKFNGNIVGSKIYNFVLTKSGKIKIGYKHHFLGNAKDVLAAGSIRFKNGKIVEIDNLSGHYKPTIKEAINFIEALKLSDIPIKRAKLSIYQITEKSNGYIDKIKLYKNIFIENLNL